MTSFDIVINSFLSKITDDMYMELTVAETNDMVQDLLINAIPYFEFPRISLEYDLDNRCFLYKLNNEEINIISTYMIVEWLSVQLANVDLVRQMYGGKDFALTSQANHMSKLNNLKIHYTELGFHLQRLYGRRRPDTNGIYRSTMCELMTKNPSFKWGDER